MSRRTIGILDYGACNLASVRQSLLGMGYRSKIGNTPADLSHTDLLILPGVGAFAAAMAALRKTNMETYIKEQARGGKPIIGICLGMQLLADRSTEICETKGLGLMPGEVVPLRPFRWHIGWNDICTSSRDPIIQRLAGQNVYFNHSYEFCVASEFRIASARLARSGDSVTAAVRRGNILGVQFHPEKSQSNGANFLRNAIEILCDA